MSACTCVWLSHCVRLICVMCAVGNGKWLMGVFVIRVMLVSCITLLVISCKCALVHLYNVICLWRRQVLK
jgi:hypothetical protein